MGLPLLQLSCRRILSRVPPILAPPPLARFAGGGSGLHFEELPGSDPPLVMAHGMLGSGANWATIAKHVNSSTGQRQVGEISLL